VERRQCRGTRKGGPPAKRVEKSSGKLYWYGTSPDPLLETDGSGTLLNEYIFFNGKRIARRDASGNVDYYVGDQLGTARVVTNAAGTIQDEVDYYPYGGERDVTGPTTGNNYKFTGKERDSESGLDNFGARYDSSQYGRFMTPDPDNVSGFMNQTDPQSWNGYAYVRNNPLNAVDPDGLDCVYVEDDKASYNSGNCIAGKNGTYVNGTIDPKSATYDSKSGTLSVGYTNSDTGAIGKAVIGNVNLSGGITTADRLDTLRQAGWMADNGVKAGALFMAENAGADALGQLAGLGYEAIQAARAAKAAAGAEQIIFRQQQLEHALRVAAGHSTPVGSVQEIKSAISSAIQSGAYQETNGVIKGTVTIQGVTHEFTAGRNPAGQIIFSNIYRQ